MSYQVSGSNAEWGFGRGRGNSYRRGQGRGFKLTKPNVWLKCETLGSDAYSIGDAQQSDKYTKMTEAILIQIQGNFNERNDVK